MDMFGLGNEDCLYLHVTVPDHDPSETLPVMVWVYGGAYMLGDAEEFGLYDPSNLSTKEKVIVVAMNYRVTTFGFMALEELMAEHNTTGNYALQDQTLALQWVQSNIAAFGGDPTRVTLFGESAGGFSVCWHLVSPGSAGLFSSAVVESGSCDTPQFFQELPYAVAFSKNYSSWCGCDGTGAALLACLRGKETLELMGCKPPGSDSVAAQAKVHELLTQYTKLLGHPLLAQHALTTAMSTLPMPTLYPLMPWGPAIDGSPTGLPDLPVTLLQRGQYNKVPTIFGTNHDEGTVFAPVMPLVAPGTKFPPDSASIEATLYHVLDMYPANITAIIVPEVLAMYPEASFPGGWSRMANIITDYIFACSARRSARAMAAHGTPVWLYQFTFKIEDALYPIVGDFHGSELVYTWDNQWPKGLRVFTPLDLQMAADMGLYWTNMARYGNPNGNGSVSLLWPQYNTSVDVNMMLQQPLALNYGLKFTQCNFFDAAAHNLTGLTGGRRQ